MSEFYRVKLDGREVSYVEADGKAKARRLALADLEVTRLTGSDVAALLASGKEVIREGVSQNDQPKVS